MAPEQNKRTFRFKPAHDVILLKEVARQRPWTAVHGETLSSWEAIGHAFNAQLAVVRPGSLTIDPKACQRRYKALIDSFISGDLSSLRSTGTPEEVNEREQLIAETKDHRAERGDRRSSRGGGAEAHSIDSHGSPLTDMLPEGTNVNEQHKRSLDVNGSPINAAKRVRTSVAASGDASAALNSLAIEFLQRHLQEESVRRHNELRLAEEKLDLEKQRFEIEKREREATLAMMNGQLELIKQLSRDLQSKR
ncbi:hypothetical protein P43SY_005309 [Pythium insidiosum]|uniref:Myb-like domain-containing protein n=1 Tax=Pythium insidiosum TaxID=114742 RepID=A0AAD5LGB4_PYTIN|nr:hypothetical protein P43SY_005309 [Pythium insidiosum]KAJ0400145.1 hypothetical protein ATCC90586_007227 [Pythium insidiosum]